MTQTINELLQSLGAALETHMRAANDVAETARAELDHLKTGLIALVGETRPGEDAPTFRAKPNDVRRDGGNVPAPAPRRNTVSDDTLLEVLGPNWATAAHIRKLLREQGTLVAEGTTYNRMRKLTAKLPDLIEASAKPERWRLKSNAARPDNENVSRLMKGRKAILCATPATLFDSPYPVHAPVLHHGNCLDEMDGIEASSVDLILADLPYGTTRSEGDIELPLDRLWEHYRRVLKPTGAVVLFASQPFTTKLAASNLEWLKYALVWEKNQPSGFLHAKNKPLKLHEDILIFSPGTTIHASRSKRRMTYNPQGAVCAGPRSVKKQGSMRYMGGARHAPGKEFSGLTNCPRSILRFPKDAGHLHPFQKPLALLEYLIKTYSNEGDVVLDNTMGSGSTCVASMRTGRRVIGIEQIEKWFEVAQMRVRSEQNRPTNDNGSVLKVLTA